MSDTWASNTDLASIAAWIKGLKRIVVLTHVKPDGDAVGSTVAVTRAINLAAKREVAIPWYWGPLPDWMPDVLQGLKHRVVDEQNRAEHDEREDPDGVLILDTGSWTQLHEVKEWLLPRTDITAVVDHHQQGDPEVAAKRFIQTNSAAACEIAVDLCCKLLGVPSASKLPLEVATPLFLGIATDTGWFRHSNVAPATMRAAAGLIEAGVNHPKLYEIIEQRDRVSRIKLMARALNSLELFDNDRVAMMTLTLQDFHDCHASSNDSGGFADIALKAEKIQVCAVVTEAFVHPGDGNITKVSFRAKDGPTSMDVNAVAKKLGGGGHVRAAGAKVSAGLAETKKKVIAAMGLKG